jgi:hypothetical protein
MQTLHSRLDPQKEKVLQVTENFGPFRAMNQFKVASYDRFQKWLKEVTGNENFGLRPRLSLESGQSLGDQLVAAMLRKVATLESDKQSLKERITFLEWQLDHGQAKEQDQALAIMEVCR